MGQEIQVYFDDTAILGPQYSPGPALGAGQPETVNTNPAPSQTSVPVLSRGNSNLGQVHLPLWVMCRMMALEEVNLTSIPAIDFMNLCAADLHLRINTSK